MFSFWIKASAIMVTISAILLGVALTLGRTRRNAIITLGRRMWSVTEPTNIFVLDIDHRVAYPVTRSSYSHRVPAWSPDGTQIAFTRQFSIQQMVGFIDSDGRNERDVPNFLIGNATPLFWSPNSTQIVLDASLPTGYDLVIVNAADLSWRRLTETRDTEFDIAWSPDGQWISYTIYHSRSDREFFTLDVNSGEIRALPSDEMQEFVPSLWSPDRSHYILVSESSNMHISIYSRDSEPIGRIDSDHRIHNIQWSPDGRYVAYVSDVQVIAGGNQARLYVIDAHSGHVHDMGTMVDTVYSWRP